MRTSRDECRTVVGAMAPEDLGQLTFGDCRNAARVVHKAEFGKEARKSVRPRGVSGLFLARAPLTLQLRLAAQQGRPMSNADQSEFSPDKITNDSSQMMGYAAGVCLASARACAAF
jgi:hypothetical protein